MSSAASLRGRLVSSMALLLALVLVLAIVSATALARLDRVAGDVVDELVAGDQLATALTSAVIEQIRRSERQIAAPDPAATPALYRLADSTHDLLHRLRALTGQGPEDYAQLTRITGAQARMEVAYAAARAWGTLGRTAEAARAAAEGSEAADHLLAEVRTLAGVKGVRATARAEQLADQGRTLRGVLWALLFLALAIGIGGAWLTVRAVDQPLAHLIAATRRFGTGDLRAADLAGMPAELAALGSAMNAMGARIRHLLAGVAQETDEITASANDFSAMSQELAATSGQVSEAMVHLSQAAEGQVTALREADLRLEELRDAGTATLRAARRVTALAASIGTMATDHRSHVEAASATLLALRETVRTSATEVREATRLASQLGELTARERLLAEKLGVLAVNASIEAARAGDLGQGMAAVAEELRLLAVRSEEVAAEGDAAVAAVQERIQATATTLDQGTTTVLGVEATAGRAATALSEILRATEQVHRAAAQVESEAENARTGLAAMHERTALAGRAATDHAVTGESVSAAAEEQAAATEEMAGGAARLSEAAERLTAMLREFRT